MFSMAGASLFLPFLPLLPKQILLTNVLTDIPEMTIATDAVDDELIQRPRRWDIGFIKKFMLTFGLVSSVFDYLTFAALFFVLDAGMAQFRTGWFIESVISAAMIVLVIRTRRPFLRSRPANGLFLATVGIVAVTFALPFTPIGRAFGLAPLPMSFLALLMAIVALYMIILIPGVERQFPCDGFGNEVFDVGQAGIRLGRFKKQALEHLRRNRLAVMMIGAVHRPIFEFVGSHDMDCESFGRRRRAFWRFSRRHVRVNAIMGIERINIQTSLE